MKPGEVQAVGRGERAEPAPRLRGGQGGGHLVAEARGNARLCCAAQLRAVQKGIAQCEGALGGKAAAQLRQQSLAVGFELCAALRGEKDEARIAARGLPPALGVRPVMGAQCRGRDGLEFGRREPAAHALDQPAAHQRIAFVQAQRQRALIERCIGSAAAGVQEAHIARESAAHHRINFVQALRQRLVKEQGLVARRTGQRAVQRGAGRRAVLRLPGRGPRLNFRHIDPHNGARRRGKGHAQAEERAANEREVQQRRGPQAGAQLAGGLNQMGEVQSRS